MTNVLVRSYATRESQTLHWPRCTRCFPMLLFFFLNYYYLTEMLQRLLVTYFVKVEVIVAVIIHSGYFLKQLLYRLNPHYLGFSILFFAKAFAWGVRGISHVFHSPPSVLFLCDKSETENTVWTSLGKQNMYKSPPRAWGWFTGGSWLSRFIKRWGISLFLNRKNKNQSQGFLGP